jgi:hypothetical protein
VHGVLVCGGGGGESCEHLVSRSSM